MIRIVQQFVGRLACLVTAALLAGCAKTPHPPAPPPLRTVLFVPGVFGDGPWYDGLRKAISEDATLVRTVTWGLPKALFAVNFSNKGVHDDAETKLAGVIDATTGPLDLVGHSAGCGVILGAIAKAKRPAGRIVLIAPSVSPGYDLTSALSRTDRLDVFYSDKDTTFLKWRCSTFGTYDAVKTAAAGYSGFTTTHPKLTQHPYDPAWNDLGHDGGHGGGTATAFVRKVVRPLLSE
ncbi:MAG TPA: hypothetical protein VF595_10120 [Tepidisphaeraceae bacterium]|jgi:pimeloyl-ACP methyl ester carboxylesterase